MTTVQYQQIMQNENRTEEGLVLGNDWIRIQSCLQRLKVLDDIEQEKDYGTKLLKKDWLANWQKILLNELQKVAKETQTDFHRRSYFLEQDELFSTIQDLCEVQGKSYQPFLAILETEWFVPYFPLSDEDDKKTNYVKAKYDKKNNFAKELLSAGTNPFASVVDEDFIDRANSTLKSETLRLKAAFLAPNNPGAIGLLVMGMIGAVGFGVGALFAPAIAAAILGPILFPTLHGAALTAAALAFFGGGSIAAGGAGMFGGSLLIATITGLAAFDLVAEKTAIGVYGFTIALLAKPDSVASDMALYSTYFQVLVVDEFQDYDYAEQMLEKFKDATATIAKLIAEMKMDKDKKKDIKNVEKSYAHMTNTYAFCKKYLEKAQSTSESIEGTVVATEDK